MKNNIMRYVSVLLVVILCLIPTYADTLSDKKNQLNSAQQHIKDKEALLSQQEAEKNKIEAEIQKLDTEVVEIEDNIKQLGTKIEAKQEEIKLSELDLEAATIKKDDQYEATKERMVQMYKNQRIGYMELVFASDNLLDAINRTKYINKISERDNDILSDYEEQIKVIEVHKDKIEEEKNDLDLLRSEEITSKEGFNEAIESKQVAMNSLQDKQNAVSREIEELEDVSQSLEADIKKITAEMEAQNKDKIPPQYGGGKFAWPVPGWYRISSEYGPRTSPIFGKTEFHTGIDIPAGYGESVVSVADGTVITAGWIRGFGNTVIVSHGSGLTTLYGHNSSLTVSAGQKVKTGDVIAKIGSTGYSTGNHLHFEVRLNNSHTNPWAYLK